MAVQDAIATIVTETPAETEAVGRVLGRALVPGDLVNLQGDLGAGKTLFVKGLAASLGYDPHDVQSPTFTLVHEHRGERLTLYHLDLYRLDDALAEIEALGFEEYLEPEDAVTAVEWGEEESPPSPAAVLTSSLKSWALGAASRCTPARSSGNGSKSSSRPFRSWVWKGPGEPAGAGRRDRLGS